jgi:HTH-type transcriptional regulator/antitoxin HigA
MDIRPVRTEQDYRNALAEIARLMDADPAEGSTAFDTLDVMATLVEAYESRHHSIDAPDPIAAIAIRMAEQGLNRRELSARSGVSESKISEVMNYKRPLSITMIRRLSEILDLPEAVLVRAYPLKSAA